MKDKDYKEILEKISAPIVVIISNDENSTKKNYTRSDFAENFSIHFMNESFEKLYGNILKVGFTTEECVSKLSKDVDWYKMACDSMETLHNILFAYYHIGDVRNKIRLPVIKKSADCKNYNNAYRNKIQHRHIAFSQNFINHVFNNPRQI